jgi:hypothetical protein
MNKLTLVFALSIVLLGCSQQTVAADGPVVKEGERQVEWPKQEESDGVAPAAVGLDAVRTDPNILAAPVPVLIPAPAVQPAGAEASAGLDASALKVQATPDGYFAVMPGKAYDMIIHGTKAFTTLPAGSPTPTADKTKYRFESAEGQHQLAFSRHGADYLIEFSCKGPPLKPCVTEAEAKAIADQLVAANAK